MNTTDKTFLFAETEVNAPIQLVWELWTNPEAIVQWNAPSAEWETIKVENDVRTGGRYLFAMALKDGSEAFNYCGIYDKIIPFELIAHTLDDGRKTTIRFSAGQPVIIRETFEAINDLSADIQTSFCKAVLDRFKEYAEAKIKG